MKHNKWERFNNHK